MAKTKRRSRSRSRSRSRRVKRGYALKTVPELKNTLRKRGLSTTGKKSTLVRRLRNSRKSPLVPKYQLSRLSQYKRSPGAVQRVTGIPCSWLPKGAIVMALEAYVGHKHAHTRKFKQRRKNLCARLARAILSNKPAEGPLDLAKIKEKFLKAHPQKVDHVLVKEVKKAAKALKKTNPAEATIMSAMAEEHHQHMKDLRKSLLANEAQSPAKINLFSGLTMKQ